MNGSGTISIESLATKRIIKRLAQGGALELAGAAWRLAGKTVPDSVVADLRARDLVSALPDGRLALSAPGAALVQRTVRPTATSPSSGFARQNRLLASTTRKIDGALVTAETNLADNPLAWLARRNLLSARQLAAGDRLRADYHCAHRQARVTMNWSAPPLGRAARSAPEGLDPTTAQIAAKRRFEAAVAAAGPGLRDVLLRVVCAGEGLESAEKALAWPARAAKLVLGFGLEKMADFYGLPDDAKIILNHSGFFN
jgi:Domain of unknown function (DUF6456)